MSHCWDSLALKYVYLHVLFFSGLEWTNKDITENYSKEGSYDLNSNDDDPMPNGRVGKYCLNQKYTNKAIQTKQVITMVYQGISFG